MRLNPQQQEIVEFPLDTAALVMAGAGSGKTTVIAHRALRLSEQLPGETVLQMLTFSNKAANEMKERVKRIGIRSSGIDRIRFDTFHSFGIKLLKADPQGYGLPEGFSLLNETDTKRSIRFHAKAAGLPRDIEPEDRRRLDPMAWYGTWSLCRQAGYDVTNPENETTLRERLIKAHALERDEVEIAWLTLTGYQAEKNASGSVDFDDLLYLPLLRLARDEAYRSDIQGGIGYVVVDEAQDTNRIQYELIRRLAMGHCGVTCVGDDDQSIYGWRGAEVTNLRRFRSQFAAHELRLEQNYRSTQSIVQTASSLIQHNDNRLGKSPFSEGDIGTAPTLSQFRSSYDMADGLATLLAARIADGVPPSELAVLYRTNRMAMLLEQSLRRRNVPYHVVGGMSLFDRSEVMAVTCALRLGRNPRDVFALKAITPFIAGFGQASVYAVAEWIEENPDESLRTLPESLPGISAARLDSLRGFYEDLIMEAMSSDSPAEFIQWVIDGPMGVLEREKDEQLRERRAQHLASLGSDISDELEERSLVEPDLTWRDVMIEVALRDARQSQAEGGQVTLSTVHRSKGLEWDEVVIAGASEGLMPLDSRDEVSEEDAGFSHLEEERRLAYVALTRAKQKCHFFHSAAYAFPGAADTNRTFEPSRFLTEMGLDTALSLSSSDAIDLDEGFNPEAFKRAFSGLSL